mgnify:CR=1 FL=1
MFLHHYYYASILTSVFSPIDENFSFEGVESAFAQTTDVQRQILLGQIQLTRYSRLDAIKAKLEDPAPADAVQAAPSVDTNNKDSDSKEVKEEEPVTVHSPLVSFVTCIVNSFASYTG